MTQVRQNHRYYIIDKTKFVVKVEMNPNKSVDCLLSDISVSGACIIADKQVFLARDKLYPLQILQKKSDENLENIANVKGKIIWYLSKEFQDSDRMFLGIQFEENIELPQSIVSEEGVAV